MDMPPVYKCVYLNHEHEQLKAEIVELENHIEFLQRKISEKNLDHARSCTISCQADISVEKRPYPPKPIRPSFDEEAHLRHLAEAQNDLLKKYENDALRNREERHFQVSPPSQLIEDYERRIIRCQRAIEHAERRAASAKNRMAKLEKRFKSTHQKLSLFDDEFFEEVDDLKFALQQATSLSDEYEKTIQMLSARLGITYPVTPS